MPTITEDQLDEAFRFAQTYPDDPQVQEKANRVKEAYNAQKAQGQESLRAMYQDRERHGWDDETYNEVEGALSDQPDLKFEVINEKYFAETYGLPKDRVRAMRKELLEAYSTKVWGSPITDDKAFFDRMGQDLDFEDEIANAAKETSLQNLGVLRSELAFKERFRENSAYVGREQKWDKEFQSIKDRFDQDLAPHRSTIKLLSAALMTKEGVGVEDPKTMDEAFAQRREIDNAPSYRELAEIVMKVPAEDRKLVIAAAVAASANDEAGRKSVMEGLVEMFDRGVKDFTEGIPSQGERLWAIGLKNQIKAGFPVSAEDAATPEAFLAAASSSMKAGISAGLTPMGDIAPAPAIEEPGDVSEEVKSGALALADRLIEAIDLRGELRNAAENEIDPITSDFVAMRGFYATARSIPYMAASFLPGGLLLNAGALQEQSYQQLRAANPTMTAEQAQLIASIGGPFQAYVERLQGKLALGQFKAVNRFFNQITRTKGAVASRFLARTTATAGLEIVQENVQDLTPFATQGLLSALDEDMPEVPWGPVYGDLLKQQPELFFAVLPLAVIGGGAGTYSDFKGAKTLMANAELIRLAGVSEAAASDIRARVIAGDMDGAQAELRRAFQSGGQDLQSVQQTISEAVPRLIEQRDRVIKAIEVGEDLDILPGIRNLGGDMWALEFNDGSGMSFNTYGEAADRMEQIGRDGILQLHEDVTSTIRRISSGIEADRGLKYLFSSGAPVVSDAAAVGKITDEEAVQAIDIADTLSSKQSDQRPTRHRVFEGGSPISLSAGPGILSANNETMAFRITGQPQIDDIISSGEVRAKKGKMRGGRTGETQWSRGHSSLAYSAASNKGRFVLVAPAQGLNNRTGGLPISDVVAVYESDGSTWQEVTPRVFQEFATSQARANLIGITNEERVATARIIGETVNEFRDNVLWTTMRFYQNFTPDTVLEEKFEGDAKYLIHQAGQRAWMVKALREWEIITGDRLFVSASDEGITNRNLIEAWSAMGKAWFVGEGDSGRGWNREKIQRIMETKLGSGLTAYAEHFAAVLRRAALIEQAKSEGKFESGNLAGIEDLLRKYSGESEQRLFERDVQREGSAIAQNLSGNPDFSSGEGTETTFSVIERGQGFKQTAMPDGMVLEGPATFSVLAHHGTPHKVDRFRLDKIGTGEGAQAYGWGLYFAENKKTATFYQKTLSGDVWRIRYKDGTGFFGAPYLTKDEAQSDFDDVFASKGRTDVEIAKVNEEASGNLYTVELLPDEDDFLDWDKPLGRQSQHVKDALKKSGLLKQYTENLSDYSSPMRTRGSNKLGSSLYEFVAWKAASKIQTDANGRQDITAYLSTDPEAASRTLLAAGIPGIRYLDGNSRSEGTGSYNYVIFDESLVRILEENGKPVEQQGGETTFSVIPIQPGEKPSHAAEKFLRENIVDLILESSDGITGVVSNRSAKKIASAGAKSSTMGAHLAAIANFKPLFEAGRTTETRVDRNNDPNISAIHRISTILRHNGAQYLVKFTVKELRGKENRIYSIESLAVENEAAPAGLMTYDAEAARIVPLTSAKEGSHESGQESTFSLLPDASNLDTEFTRMFSPFQRSPELRARLGMEMRRRVAEQVTKLRPILRANRTKASIEAERKRRQDEIFTEKLDTLSAGEIQALANENLLEDNSLTPILAELLREKTYLTKSGKRVRYWTGSLMSKSEANRRGYDTTGGEWDAVPEGLPPYVYGGSITPDEAATMFDFETPEAFFDALASEIQSRGDRKQEIEDAKRRVRELEKEARQEARAWADEAMKERKTVGGDRAVLLGFLRTLDAITRALPAEVRGKIGGSVALAKLVTPAAMLDEIESRVERIDVELERYLKKEADDRRKALFETAKPKREAGKKPKGKAGADIHDLFDRLKEALLWDGDQAEAWATMLEDRIGKGELSAEAEAHAKIEANLVRLFSDWKNADAARRTAAVDAGEEVWRVGYLAEKERIAKERERRAEIRAEIIAGTGKLGSRPERVVKAQQDAGLSGQWKEWFLSLFNFEQVAGFAMGAESKWTLWFSDAQREAEAKKLDEVQAVLDGLDELFRELGGSRLGGEKLQWKLSQPSFETKAGGKMSELEGVTALLMWRQEDGKRHMRGKRDENGKIVSAWSYDETFIAEIEKNLSTEALAVMDYLTDQYAGEYETLNPIFRELNGINLPRNDKYSPLTVKPQQAPGGQTTDPVTGSTMSNGSMTPGSLRTRAQVVAEPDFRNAVEVFVGHKKQLAHWKAYAVFSRDAQAILGNREVGNAIEAASGQEAAKVLRSWLDLFAQGGVRDAGSHLALTKALGAAMGRASAVQLVGRLGTLAIQTTQLGAAAAKMPVRDYIVRLSKLLTGNLGWGEALNSPYIQRRLALMPASVQVAMEGLRAGKPNMIKHAAQRVGQLLSGTDALFTAGTYAMVFDYQLTKATRAGVDPVTAAEIARNEAERIVDEVAQPTRQGTRSLFEATATNPLGRVAWAFASEARKNMALVAYTGAKRPSGDLAKALLYVIVFNGVLSALIRTAWRDLRDDEEDEDEWSVRRILLSVASEPLYGFPGFGEIAQDAIFAAAGEWKPDGSILDAPVKAPPAIVRAPENFGMVLEGDFEQPLRDLETILMAGGLFNDTVAGLASFSHVLRDAESLIRNFIPNTP